MGNSSSSDKDSSDEDGCAQLPRQAAHPASVIYNSTAGWADEQPECWQVRDAKMLVVRRGFALPLIISLPYWQGRQGRGGGGAGGAEDIKVEVTLHPSGDGQLPTIHISQGSNRLLEGNQDPACVVVTGVERHKQGAEKTSKVSLNVFVPVSASVGAYTLDVTCSLASGDRHVRVGLDFGVLLTYNAWNPLDAVHSQSQQLLVEHLQSEMGRVCLGTQSHPLITACNFGQRSWSVFRLAVYLAAKARKARSLDESVEQFVAGVADSLARTALEAEQAAGERSHCTAALYDSPTLAERLLQGENVIHNAASWCLNALLVAVLRTFGLPCRLVTAYNISNRPSPSQAVDVLLPESSAHESDNFLRSETDANNKRISQWYSQCKGVVVYVITIQHLSKSEPEMHNNITVS